VATGDAVKRASACQPTAELLRFRGGFPHAAGGILENISEEIPTMNKLLATLVAGLFAAAAFAQATPATPATPAAPAVKAEVKAEKAEAKVTKKKAAKKVVKKKAAKKVAKAEVKKEEAAK
jgi:hypothetical protein